MYRPLELPLRVRVWNFVRGLLLYGTVYWKRASDGLNPPPLTRRDRQAYQPTRNLEIIKPREKPRARLVGKHHDKAALPAPPLHMPVVDALPEDAATPAEPVIPLAVEISVPLAKPRAAPVVPRTADEGQVIVKCRRSTRRRKSVLRTAFYAPDTSADGGGGIFARLFKRGGER